MQAGGAWAVGRNRFIAPPFLTGGRSAQYAIRVKNAHKRVHARLTRYGYCALRHEIQTVGQVGAGMVSHAVERSSQFLLQ